MQIPGARRPSAKLVPGSIRTALAWHVRRPRSGGNVPAADGDGAPRGPAAACETRSSGAAERILVDPLTRRDRWVARSLDRRGRREADSVFDRPSQSRFVEQSVPTWAPTLGPLTSTSTADVVRDGDVAAAPSSTSRLTLGPRSSTRILHTAPWVEVQVDDGVDVERSRQGRGVRSTTTSNVNVVGERSRPSIYTSSICTDVIAGSRTRRFSERG